VRAAIDATTAAGTLTKDLGGSATTEDVTSALVAALREPAVAR
jgi:tartrate dehydrogenase/decarboxylase / D-malate dehydrogenase